MKPSINVLICFSKNRWNGSASNFAVSGIVFVILIISMQLGVVAQEKVVDVVAEGTGTSLEAAQEDAYRQAVRTVVGMYVDAKTVVENDELIEDRILSASNGFVKTANTIPTSIKEKDGIWRVRVFATVEVSELSARLKSENITIRKLDGESLFAKALTKMERKQGVEQVLTELFKDLPSMVNASLVGEPDYEASSGEMVYKVQLRPDVKAYKEFMPRLTQALDKLCTKKLPESVTHPKTEDEIQTAKFEFLKRDPRKSATEGIVSVLTFWTDDFQTLRFSNYLVDFGAVSGSNNSLRTDHWVKSLTWRNRGFHSYGSTDLEVTAKFVDAAGELVNLDSWRWQFDYFGNSSSLKNGTKCSKPTAPMLMVVPLARVRQKWLEIDMWDPWGDRHNFFMAVAPVCLGRFGNRDESGIIFRASTTAIRKLKIPIKDLKRIAKVELELKTSESDD